MNEKKLFAVYGNCQSQIIARYMNSCTAFSAEYDYLEIPGIHEMTPMQLADFKSKAPGLSLLIFQNVQRGEFATTEILPHLSKGCAQIRLPSLFFNGYNPEMAYLRQSRSTLFYHDRIMLQFIDDFEGFKERLLVDEYFFPESFSKDCVDVSLNELDSRERNQGTDIKISDFIAEHYKENRLFHVLNHPSAGLVREVAIRVLSALCVKGTVSEHVPVGALDQTQFPIYRSHYLNLGLVFPNEPEYLWAGKPCAIGDFFSIRKTEYATLDLDFAREDEFAFRKPVVRGWDLAGELQF